MTLKAAITLLFVIVVKVSFGQDTIRYSGILANALLSERLELYPDSTFKWENEYDQSWKEFGRYEINDSQLQLKHYIKFQQPATMTIADSIAKIRNPFRMTRLEFAGDKMYQLDEKGKRVKRVKDKSISTKWSWLFGHRHHFYFKREGTTNKS